MRRVAITNQKGGAGKTTTAVNLAACLAELGQRVVLLDLDPQGNGSHWLGSTGPTDRGLAGVFTDGAELAALITDTPMSGLSLIPSSPFLLGVERSDGAETALREAVERLPRRRFDWLIIDCPPSLGVLTLSALAAVTELIVPVEAHFLALEGIGALVQTVERIQQTLNPKLKVGAVVPCRVSRTRLAREVVKQLRATFGPLVTETVIRENVRLAEAPSWHQPISVYAPSSNGTADYRALAGELLGQKTPGTPRTAQNTP